MTEADGDSSRSLTLDTVEPEPSKEPYDPAPEREAMRGVIAWFLLLVFAGIVAASFVSLWFKWLSTDDLKMLLTATFSPIIGLVGAVTGFYYGGKTAKE